MNVEMRYTSERNAATVDWAGRGGTAMPFPYPYATIFEPAGSGRVIYVVAEKDLVLQGRIEQLEARVAELEAKQNERSQNRNERSQAGI